MVLRPHRTLDTGPIIIWRKDSMRWNKTSNGTVLADSCDTCF